MGLQLIAYFWRFIRMSPARYIKLLTSSTLGGAGSETVTINKLETLLYGHS